LADGTTYDALDLSLPEFTNRTRLYHLRPLGIGTAMIESLTGYIIRLAGAHVVSPRALLYKELGQCVGTYQSAPDRSRHPYLSFVYDAHTLNGLTESAEKWAAAVGVATGVENIRLLTMLAWQDVLSAQGLIRTKRAWCAWCYQEWRLRDQEIYEPLVWMLEAVSICPLHHRPLTTICPHCGREPYVMSSWSFPGHCSSCGQWLGVENVALTDEGKAADLNCARCPAELVASLLARSSRMERSLSGEALRINLRTCLNDLAEGNESLLGRAVEIHQKTVKAWLAGRTLPVLGNLLKICCRLELPLLRFLTEPMTSDDSDWEHAREVVSRYHTSRARSRRVAAVRTVLQGALRAPEPTSLLAVALKAGFKHERSLRAYDAEACSAIRERYQSMQDLQERSGTEDSVPTTRVEEVLEVALWQDPPPSIRDVSLSLGLQDASWLVSRFPVQCRLLVQRSKDYRRNHRLAVETILKTALIAEPPPTVKEVAKRAGLRSGQMLRMWFPDLYRALAARASRRRDWWLAKIQSILEAMAVEEPPPSGKAAAARAGVAGSHIRKLFPDLWRELVAQYATNKKQENANSRDAFQIEVRRIAQELLSTGKYPSRCRVRALLPESKLRGTHLIVREVKKVVDDFSGRTVPVAAHKPSS
jgi:hypothetical protein